MPLMASRGASATMTIAGVGDPLSPQTGPLVLRIKELEEQHLAFRKSLVCAFNQLLDLKDISTVVHTTRLAEWAIRVARKLNIPEEHIYQVEVAALLHDIGKIGLPDAILKKQGPRLFAGFGMHSTTLPRSLDSSRPFPGGVIASSGPSKRACERLNHWQFCRSIIYRVIPNRVNRRAHHDLGEDWR